MSSWDVESQELRAAGFGDQEIAEEGARLREEMTTAGFAPPEVDKYFGIKELDTAPVKEKFQANLTKAPAKEASTFLDYIEAGWDMSVSGLIAQGQAPDVVLPENAGMFARIASQVGMIAGDIPAMVAGAAGGAAAGTAVAGPVGTVVGGGAGGFAAPAAIRESLMQAFEKGEVQDFGDFWERTSKVLIETAKGAVIGGATAGVGGIVAKTVAGPILQTSARLASEVATMTTVGAAMEGHIPKPMEFVEGAILVGGMHGAVSGASRLRQIYAKTGVKPAEVIAEAEINPVVKQELLIEGDGIPRAYEGMIDPKLKQQAVEVSKPPTKEQVLETEGVKVEAPVEIDARQAILDRIVPSDKKAPDTTSLKERVGQKFSEAYTKFVDDLNPIKEFSETLAQGKELKTIDDPYMAARLTRGSAGKGDQFINQSPFKFGTFENVGKPLKEILAPIEGRLDDWRAFAVAKRAIEKEGQGVKTGVPLEQAKEYVQKNKAEFEQVTKEVQDYNNHLVDYLIDSGIVSKESATLFREANKDHIPFYRLMDEGGGKGPGKGLAVKNPIKSMKGSEREIIDPIESIIKNTYTFVALAEKNRVGTNMVKQWELNGKAPELMEKVGTPMKKTEISAKEISKFAEEHGVQLDGEAMTVFKPESKQLATDEIAIFREGKREIYKVPEAVAEAVNKLDGQSVGMLMKILAKPAQALRAGTTIMPEFAAKNFIRDQIGAFNLSKRGFVPLVDTVRGLGSLLKKDEHYQNWLKGGGANAAMVSLDRAYIQENIFKLSKETGLIDKTWNVMKSPFELLRVGSELIENSTRLGEFKKSIGDSKDPNRIMRAAFDSREVTLDFARMGAQTKGFNMITAFWNVSVQGLDRTARAFKEDPMGMTAKTAASITMPSVLLWWANKDDPRWQEIPRWQKDLFWIVMTEEHVYRIPKPFEIGIIFGSMPERILENYFTENPNAMKDFGDTLMEGFTPSFMPTFAVPVVEHFANKSTFTGQDIIPRNLEGIAPEYRYTEYTSEAGKLLGKFVSYIPGIKDTSMSSPMVLENYIRAWSGGAGMMAVKAADQILIKSGLVPDPVKPASALADIPVIKAFVIRYPSASAQSIQDFYDNYEENKQMLTTVKHLTKTGDFDSAQAIMEDPENEDKLLSLEGIKGALTAQSQFIHSVNRIKDMEPEEKRQLIDGAYKIMIEAAKQGNEIVNEFKKLNKESKTGE